MGHGDAGVAELFGDLAGGSAVVVEDGGSRCAEDAGGDPGEEVGVRRLGCCLELSLERGGSTLVDGWLLNS